MVSIHIANGCYIERFLLSGQQLASPGHSNRYLSGCVGIPAAAATPLAAQKTLICFAELQPDSLRGRYCPAHGTLELEMALHELAKLLAVFIAHVHEFDAAAVRPDIADDGGEIDLAQTGADFELDGVADA